MLDALVGEGKLPAVVDRLPLNPLVITPLDRVGTHGGDWNSAIVGGGSLSMLFRYQAYEPLLRYKPDWSGVVPNVAEHYESNADATEFTFRLRKGMKWSDGQPFTTEDIMFWYEDIFNYEGLSDIGQNHLRAGGKKARFEALDDVTFKVIFAAPNGLFPLRLAWANDDQTTRAPKHYLKQFHIKYNPNAEQEAKAKGASGWIQLFQREAGLVVDNEFFQNSQRPVIIDIAVYENEESMAIFLVNLTNPMMMKGPLREVYPIGEQTLSIDLPKGRSSATVKLLVKSEAASCKIVGNRAEITVPSIRDLETVHLTWHS
ncbi:ABC transporter substrate-binding protein [Agrobacterium pusense]|nr:ABC transporter substrate-binding protein [Agrobacterium pusense]WFN87516.1 ABC transporter substrate-binding protein [Agrobacterium pusense]